MYGSNFPQHEISPLSFECERCRRGELELLNAVIPISCMSDAEIEWTNLQVQKMLVRA
jgi:hypothetical protein